jgi:hypothetical protein
MSRYVCVLCITCYGDLYIGGICTFTCICIDVTPESFIHVHVFVLTTLPFRRTDGWENMDPFFGISLYRCCCFAKTKKKIWILYLVSWWCSVKTKKNPHNWVLFCHLQDEEKFVSDSGSSQCPCVIKLRRRESVPKVLTPEVEVNVTWGCSKLFTKSLNNVTKMTNNG